MPMPSAALPAPITTWAEDDPAPALSWPPTPANDPIVLSPEPFDGRLHGSRRTRRAARLGGVVAVAIVGLIIVAAAAILTVGRFGAPSSRASIVLDPAAGEATTASLDRAADLAAGASAVASPAGPGGTAPDLAEGLNALRSRMQVFRSTESISATRGDPASAPASAAEPAAIGQPAEAESTARTPAAIAPAPISPARASPASATEPGIARSGPAAAEVGAMLERARGLIETGDIAAARRLAEYAAGGGDGDALFALAETFDPAQLARWRVRGVRADPEKARALYRRALERGVAGAKARLAGLP